MFIGTTGVERVVQRACEVMRELGSDHPEDVRKAGAIDLPTIQRYLNFHYTVSLDLFGSELSSNAATYFNAGLKGRFRETSIDDDHVLTDDTYPVLTPNGSMQVVEEPALQALNTHLQDEYIDDCAKGVKKWNKAIQKAGIDFELKLPHRGFNRQVGHFAEYDVSPDGQMLDHATWEAHRDEWLPSDGDTEFVASLMHPVVEPGKMAAWIAPPKSGINNQPVEYEYVRLNR